jgi:hypothetical protein
MTADVPGTGREVLLRDGWHAPESFAGETFRWARNDARLIVPAFEPGIVRLTFELEIGPGVRDRPAHVAVYNLADQVVEEKLVEGHATLSIVLRSSSPTVHALRVHVASSGKVTGIDRRMLDFRLLWVRLDLL